jgi:hypothetical protein
MEEGLSRNGVFSEYGDLAAIASLFRTETAFFLFFFESNPRTAWRATAFTVGSVRSVFADCEWDNGGFDAPVAGCLADRW